LSSCHIWSRTLPFLTTILAESEYTLAVKFDLKSVKHVLAETDLNSSSLFISRLAESECRFVIKSELESVLVESESFNYLYTPNLSSKSLCDDLLTCIPLFIESIFEVS
jgi:hypothetical protein